MEENLIMYEKCRYSKKTYKKTYNNTSTIYCTFALKYPISTLPNIVQCRKFRSKLRS